MAGNANIAARHLLQDGTETNANVTTHMNVNAVVRLTQVNKTEISANARNVQCVPNTLTI